MVAGPKADESFHFELVLKVHLLRGETGFI